MPQEAERNGSTVALPEANIPVARPPQTLEAAALPATDSARPRRGAIWGCLAGVLVLGILGVGGILGLPGGSLIAAPPRPGQNATDGLWIQAVPQDDRITLLVADPSARALAVYQVDPATGSLTLRSSRDITWDLLVGDFNAQDPAPAVIRGMLEKAAAPGLR